MKKKIFGNLPLVVIGAFIIIYIGLGLVFFQQQGEVQSLSSQMALQRTILQKPRPDIEKLNSQLEKSGSEFEIRLISLASSEQGTEIYSVLVDLGRKNNTEVMSVEASLPITGKAGNANETILPYSLVARGSQSDILDFISSLIQGGKLLQGLELKSINIQNGTLAVDPVTLNLELAIHTWPNAASGMPAAAKISGVKK